jgi:hypothetical protein
MHHRPACLILFLVFLAGTALFPATSSRAVSRTVVISEFRTRGPAGEGDDFIELFNLSDSLVNIANWQVKVLQTRSTNGYTVGIPGGVVLFPGSHYLLTGPSYSGSVRGDQGLPAEIPDAVGIAIQIPSGIIQDSVGTDFGLYGEGPLLRALFTNEDRSYERKPGGAAGSTVDTDHNSTDFQLISPSDPQNYQISLPTATGKADPPSVMPGQVTLLTLEVMAGKSPPSTGLYAVVDLSSVGGPSSQQFFNDGTRGDLRAGDQLFSYEVTVPASTPLGAKTLGAFVSDVQGRIVSTFIVLDVGIIPEPARCDQERGSVKTGTDPDALLVGLLVPQTPTTIPVMRSWSAPALIPSNNRVAPYETTAWVMSATLTQYKKEEDADYVLVLADPLGNTLIARIPCPCCVGATSPFASDIAKARSEFDSRFAAAEVFQTANIPVIISGVGLFEIPHGETGAALNGMGLEPVLGIKFLANLRTPQIINAMVSGKKLLVSGLNFDIGATIYIEEEKQKTSNDGVSPSAILIGKKAGKKIGRGETVTLTVKNADGITSEPFSFKRPD